MLERLPKGVREVPPLDAREAEAAFDETIAFWRQWVGRSNYRGRWREMVNRSALVLKLLDVPADGRDRRRADDEPPEAIGGSRNWDYRYTWIRDAAFSLYALLRLGFTEEAEAFMGWLEARAGRERDPGRRAAADRLRHRRAPRPERETLDHLDGYLRLTARADRQRRL